MDSSVNSLRVELGDAIFHIFKIHINTVYSNESPACHSHRYYELHYAKSGSYVYVFEDREVELTAGNILIIPPDLRHYIIDKEDPRYSFSVLSFSLTKGENAESVYGAFHGMIDNACLKPIPMPRSFCEHIENLRGKIPSDDIFDFCYLKKEGTALIEQLTLGLKGYLPTSFTPSFERNRDDVLALLDVMVGRGEFSLSDIARHINYSPRHTARLIKQIYGTSLSGARRGKNIDEDLKSAQKGHL